MHISVSYETMSYSFRRRAQKHDYARLHQDLHVEEEEDLGPITPEEKATAAAGLNAGYACAGEVRAFRSVLKNAKGVVDYLTVR